MKESQSMQKEEFQEGDFMNIFEMPSTSEGNNLAMQDFSQATAVNNVNVVNQNTLISLLDGQNQITIQQHQPDGSTQSSTVDMQYTTDINAHFQNQEQ